jgi:type II restriction enzyme
LKIFNAVEAMNPSKDATDYWREINRTMLDFGKSSAKIWQKEKAANLESIQISKKLALTFLAQERERIMKLTHDEALQALIDMQKLDSRTKVISAVSDNGLMLL